MLTPNTARRQERTTESASKHANMHLEPLGKTGPWVKLLHLLRVGSHNCKPWSQRREGRYKRGSSLEDQITPGRPKTPDGATVWPEVIRNIVPWRATHAFGSLRLLRHTVALSAYSTTAFLVS